MSPKGLTTVSGLAEFLGTSFVGDGNSQIVGIASLSKAKPGDLSLYASRRYRADFEKSSATAVIIATELAEDDGPVANRILSPEPLLDLTRSIEQFWPAESGLTWSVHQTARIGAGTTWRERIHLGAKVVIGPEVRLGSNCVIETGSVIGARCRLGDGCHLYPESQLLPDTVLGDRVTVHSGTRLGVPGFGYVFQDGKHQRIPHVGGCVIEDDVEIGSNTTVDRGSLDDTVVGAGSKLDNLVHIGHNVHLGKRCLVMAQVGVAGSSVLEDDVVAAGQAGIADHLRVGSRARLAAQSGVIGDVASKATVSGYPARPHRQVLRETAVLERLSHIIDKLEALAEDHGE